MHMHGMQVMELDLLSLDSVRQFVNEWDQLLEPLHILINNAGILRMGGITYAISTT